MLEDNNTMFCRDLCRRIWNSGWNWKRWTSTCQKLTMKLKRCIYFLLIVKSLKIYISPGILKYHSRARTGEERSSPGTSFRYRTRDSSTWNWGGKQQAEGRLIFDLWSLIFYSFKMSVDALQAAHMKQKEIIENMRWVIRPVSDVLSCLLAPVKLECLWLGHVFGTPFPHERSNTVGAPGRWFPVLSRAKSSISSRVMISSWFRGWG